MTYSNNVDDSIRDLEKEGLGRRIVIGGLETLFVSIMKLQGFCNFVTSLYGREYAIYMSVSVSFGIEPRCQALLLRHPPNDGAMSLSALSELSYSPPPSAVRKALKETFLALVNLPCQLGASTGFGYYRNLYSNSVLDLFDYRRLPA